MLTISLAGIISVFFASPFVSAGALYEAVPRNDGDIHSFEHLNENMDIEKEIHHSTTLKIKEAIQEAERKNYEKMKKRLIDAHKKEIEQAKKEREKIDYIIYETTTDMTLKQLAEMFHTDVEEILKINAVSEKSDVAETVRKTPFFDPSLFEGANDIDANYIDVFFLNQSSTKEKDEIASKEIEKKLIKAGIKIYIPSKRTIQTEKGDTLAIIAEDFGVSAKELAEWNNIDMKGEHILHTEMEEGKTLILKLEANQLLNFEKMKKNRERRIEAIKKAKVTLLESIKKEAAKEAEEYRKEKGIWQKETGANPENKASEQTEQENDFVENSHDTNENNDSYQNEDKKKTMMMKATAYTAECEGCTGITKMGINLLENRHAKVIAVDPRVIPLGTRVYVEGYGEAIAGDIGGAIKGNRIDLHMPTKQEAYAWGVRNVRLTILE